MDKRENPKNSLTFKQLLGSTLAAAFGVQSSKNRARDFAQPSGTPFIFMGIGFTVVFVLFLLGMVNLLIAQLS